MSQIAIIDDNAEQSGTVKTYTELVLEEMNSDFKVITSFPFRDINAYFEFIHANDIVAIIIDEKLNDQSFDDNGPVDYKGNDLVSVLRLGLKELPIYTITAVANDPDLLAKFSQYDYIIARSDFHAHSEKYVPIIVRSAQRFLEQNTLELSKFDSLTKKVASGKYEPEDAERLSALQVKMELPFSGFDDRKEWLKTYESQISLLADLKEKLTAKIQGK